METLVWSATAFWGLSVGLECRGGMSVIDDRVPEPMSCERRTALAGKAGEGCGEPEVSGAPEAVPGWVHAFDPQRAEIIDVRPILAEHGEPFGAVMARVNALSADVGLIIEAPFNPLPLRRVLDQKGFATYGEHLSDRHWRIWCAREDKSGEGLASTMRIGGAAVWAAADGVHIDVRGLAAPAPLHAILSLIDGGRHQGVIVVHHERDPLFLYPELAERAWTHAVVEGEPGEVRLILRQEAV